MYIAQYYRRGYTALEWSVTIIKTKNMYDYIYQTIQYIKCCRQKIVLCWTLHYGISGFLASLLFNRIPLEFKWYFQKNKFNLNQNLEPESCLSYQRKSSNPPSPPAPPPPGPCVWKSKMIIYSTCCRREMVYSTPMKRLFYIVPELMFIKIRQI
jgi:hypothetical protein